MQSAPEDLDTQKFLQAHVAELDAWSEVFEKCELAWLVGRFKHGNVKPEFLGEAIHKGRVQPAFFVERSHSASTLASLDDELYRSRIEPSVPT